MVVDAVRRIGRFRVSHRVYLRNLHEKFALLLFSKRYPSSCSEPEFHLYYSTQLFHHLVVSHNCSWDHVLVIRKYNLKFCQVYLSAQVFHYSCFENQTYNLHKVLICICHCIVLSPSCFENQTYNLHKVLICICHCIVLSPSSEYKTENKNSVK